MVSWEAKVRKEARSPEELQNPSHFKKQVAVSRGEQLMENNQSQLSSPSMDSSLQGGPL